ncbi:MAG TPA: FAD-dependent oxidoreductase, partial [Candidatus Limnocylindrales bacterium]|nr:FAD-dependent oxidoreductase [Candidatus Limnocylindrales bacterium]
CFMDVVIIGGVAGGMSAATRLRRLDESARITVIERSGYVSFANCGLPYHVGGVIEDRASLLLQTPESLATRFALDVRVHHEVTHIDRARKVVRVLDHSTGTEKDLAYDALVLSPGARPVRPPIPGIERALTLRTVEDTDALVEATRDAASAVVIGGGFIGIEMAENLVRRGIPTAIVEATSQVMAPLDPELATLVHARIVGAGVALRLGASVTAIGEDDVTLSTGERLAADVVVAAVGVRPESGLAAAAGLALGPRGGIAIDEQFRTSDPAVYAVGDAVEKRDGLDGSEALVPLANTANRQGRFVADVIAGRPGTDRGVHGTAIVGVFGLQVATTGWNEKRLRAAGRPYRAIHTHPASHAGYYPGAYGMALKLLVDPETDAILGAQGVGAAGVDKRIDVIATAMAGGLTASDLADLELSYAPQFSSAKDPVNMLGYVNRNTADGLTPTIQWHELAGALAGGATLLDVRSPAEHRRGAIPGSLLVPVDELRDRLDEVPEGPLIVHCAVGVRGHTAVRILRQHGREDVRNLDGGYSTWLAGSRA